MLVRAAREGDQQAVVAAQNAPDDAGQFLQQPQGTWVWDDSSDAAAAYVAFFLWLALGSWPTLQAFQLAGENGSPCGIM